MKKKLLMILFALSSLIALTGCTLDLRAEVPYTSPNAYEQLRIDMLAEVKPSVVVVRTETGHGSGTIFRSEDMGGGVTRYYVLTNYHVIEDGGEMYINFGGAIDDIAVTDFTGNSTYDVAVVRFETTLSLRVEHIAPIDDNTITQIIVGQDVYAIGTPQNIDKFDYVTAGIVSMDAYDYNGITDLAIMHDAELNPGNSGGPLFNLNGDVIGINVAKVATVSTVDGTIAAEGLNYALNINKVAPIIRAFTNSDYEAIVRKPRLGVTVQDVGTFLTENDSSLIPPNPTGVVVIDLDPTRNAINFLEIYDLIVGMDGDPVQSIADIQTHLLNANFGDMHTLTVMRYNGSSFVSVTVTFALS